MTEEWRAVQGFEGRYEVSSAGRVRTISRICPGPIPRQVVGRLLGLNRDRDGYLRVRLSNRRGLNRMVHRLVLEAFVGPCPDGMECRHLNGVPSDNRLSNLAWSTHAENCSDKVQHGTVLVGVNHANSKLDEHKIREIRASRESSRTLAARFGVDQSTINDVRRRETWKHV